MKMAENRSLRGRGKECGRGSGRTAFVLRTLAHLSAFALAAAAAACSPAPGPAPPAPPEPSVSAAQASAVPPVVPSAAPTSEPAPAAPDSGEDVAETECATDDDYC